MITLTGGNVQSLAGVAVPNGYVELTLTGDASIIAAPNGFVAGGITTRFDFDGTANLKGACKIWSNAELSPQTQYMVEFFDPNGARLSKTPLFWQFTQSAGASVDIGTIVPVAMAGAQASLIFGLTAPNLVLAGPSSGSPALPTFRSLTGADIPTPTASTLGGVTSITAVAHQFLTALSTAGAFSQAQPAAADLSDGTDGTGKVILAAASTGTGNVVRATNPTISGPTVSNVAGLTLSVQRFTTNGTFTVPASTVKATVVGAGAAGGGSGGAGAGGGGGGGGTAVKWLAGLTPGLTIAVTVGAGGTGVSNGTGNPGGNSSIASGSQTIGTVTGNGGSGGTTGGAGGNGGGASGGDLNQNGSDGDNGVSGNFGGQGGPSQHGGAGRGAASFNGQPGYQYGGGGGGSQGTGPFSGGGGGIGVVIFEWIV